MKKTLHGVVETLAVMIAAAAVALFAACSDGTKSDDPDDPDGPDNTIKYTITFKLGYETSKSPPASKKVEAGKAAGTLPNPIRGAWDFTGWKDASDTPYTKDTIINGDVTLIAQWDFVPGPTNPFITDRFTADPAAFIDDDGTVYLVCGEDQLPPNAPSNEYFRIVGWHMYSTTDMKTFKYENFLLRSDDFSFGTTNSAWASQIIKGLDGKYYFYVTVHYNGGGYEDVIGVAVAENPTGPYVPVQTPLVRHSWVQQDTGYERSDNIDPTVLIDDDGTAYLVWGQLQPRIAKLKENMTEIERPIKLLFPPEWKTEDRCEEGPFLYKRNGIYYMIYASMRLNSSNGNAVAETISYSMAPSLDGPWTDGVVISDTAPNSYTIHPAVIEFNGQAYIFYHNGNLRIPDPVGGTGQIWTGATGRRSLCVDYLYFNEDGTIKFVDVRSDKGLSEPPVDE
jgi:beta-xylosidase